ncbi:hypothetical protein TNCV_3313351 [Trichonephila clavipes]|nr:hypothetical protein TNCV_3313351 [Trichonephila clavipes]
MDFLGRDQKVAGKAVLEDVEKLKKLYYNPKEPASFGGAKRLRCKRFKKKLVFENFFREKILIHFISLYDINSKDEKRLHMG